MNPFEIAKIINSQILKAKEDLANKTFYRGVVAAVDGNKVDVEVEGNEDPIPNVICLDHYTPTEGDNVLLISIGSTGANFVVIGSYTL